MMWFFFGIIGLFIIILLSRVYVSFTMFYTDQEHHLTLSISILRLRLFKKTYPLVPGNLNVLRPESEFESFSSKLHNLLVSVKLIRETLIIILKKLKLHRWDWVTKGGTGDAALTGVTTGGIWSIKTMAAGFLGNFSRFECKPVIQVVPDYQKVYISSTLDCMVSIRIAQAIHVILKIIRLFFSVKQTKTASAS